MAQPRVEPKGADPKTKEGRTLHHRIPTRIRKGRASYRSHICLFTAVTMAQGDCIFRLLCRLQKCLRALIADVWRYRPYHVRYSPWLCESDKMNELRLYDRTVMTSSFWGAIRAALSDAQWKLTCSPEFINVKVPLDTDDFICLRIEISVGSG